MPDILIIDSSDLVRELLGQALEGQKYSTACATVETALQAIRQSPPAMVILDPGQIGTKGWVLLAEIRKARQDGSVPPVVIVSDHSGKPEVLRAAQLGVRDYMLKKRFSLAELLTRVRRHVAPGKDQVKPAVKPVVSAPRPQASAQAGQLAGPRPPRSDSAEREAALDAAREMGLVLSTREETLEKLDSAPLKTLPGVVAELISLVNSPRGTVADVAQILRRDPVLTARILRVANSASFSTQKARISTVEEAVKNIGVAGVRNLVVNVGVFDAFGADSVGGLRVTRVWQHCLGVALLMEKLTPQDASVPPGSAYLVGLCHDLGDIVLRQHFPTANGAIDSLKDQCGCALRLAQSIVFGMPYSELMTQLLTRLRLPPIITLPIEEFFERGERKGTNGAGSLLGRSLRAVNVYAHGLLLAPGADEPITPLTRAECANTFGDVGRSHSEDEMLRGDALATASVLAGLSSRQTEQMCEPLVPQLPLRVGYSRHVEYAKLDPLATFLRLTAREVPMLPALGGITPNSLAGIDALVVAGSRAGTSEVLVQEVDRIRSLIAKQPVPVLFLAGPGDVPAAAAENDITFHRLPVDIQSIGQFLLAAKEKSRSSRLAVAA